MGGRTHARLARPMPTPRQGLGENHRKLQRLGLHRQHQTPLTQARKILLPNVNFWVGHLHPGVVLAHTLLKKGVPLHKVAFAMFKTTGSERENGAARQYLKQAGYMVFDGEVPVPTGYGSASDMGKVITETSFKTLNGKAATLAQRVIDMIAEISDRKVA